MLEKQCLQDLSTDSMQTSERGSCVVDDREDGTRHIRIDSYSDTLGPISIEAESLRDLPNQNIPSVARFRLLLNDMCAIDGGNEIEFPELRVCGEPSPFVNFCLSEFSDLYLRVFQKSLETYVGEELPVVVLDNAYLKAETQLYDSLSELYALPLGVQQNYPTSIVREFFGTVRSNMAIEQIMEEYRKKISKLREFENTPFTLRKSRASSVFVCRRSAHEIIGSGFLFACGDYAETFLSFLKIVGREARLVKVVGIGYVNGKDDLDGGHDLVEIFDRQTGRWILTDPTVGRVYRKYKGEKQFITLNIRWVVMGRWKSSWDAGCHSGSDLGKLRAAGKRNNYSPQIPFVDITDQPKQAK